MEQRSMLLLPLLLLFRCSIYPPFWVHSLSVSVSVCLFVYLCIFFSIVCLLTRGANPSNMKLMDSITTKHVSASLLIAAVESKILKMPVGIAKRVISCMRVCAIVWVFCSFFCCSYWLVLDSRLNDFILIAPFRISIIDITSAKCDCRISTYWNQIFNICWIMIFPLQHAVHAANKWFEVNENKHRIRYNRICDMELIVWQRNVGRV